ncbi:MAG TPA: cytochrome c [Chthoniobacterales bacterium]|jgi:mono/diheme cytochrome c family protein|nr:cytochrome c [Chthoniobacterales bacterium]
MKKLTEREALLFAFIVSCICLLATLGIAFAVGTALSGKQSQVTESRRFNSETVIQGRQVFVIHCVECHGFDARGDEGSDLHNLRSGDGLIHQIITGGIKGEMPGYGKVLNEADVRALIAYLRTLRN